MNTSPIPPTGPRVELKVHIATSAHGRKQIRKGPVTEKVSPPREELPRITRLLALARRWDKLIEEGAVANRAEIARMMGLSRARVTQIMALLYLAPEIQEQILASPPDAGLGGLTERSIRALTAVPTWDGQRQLWASLLT